MVNIFLATLNALEQQIAVINQLGEIVFVNSVWIKSGEARGIPKNFEWIGLNYLSFGTSSHSDNLSFETEAMNGIGEVISNKRKLFDLEYTDHSSTERRWLQMIVKPMQDQPEPLYVITHTDISKYKLEAEEAELLSTQDPLTSLVNRRFMNQFLHNEWQRALRHNHPMSILAIDVDKFKGLNDLFGHLAGDDCLCQIADLLKSYSKRPSDLAVRLGGDEFLLILGNTPIKEALKIAEKFRKSVLSLKIQANHTELITVSIGVSGYKNVAHAKEQDLIQLADLALYQAKGAGRNRVESSQPSTSNLN